MRFGIFRITVTAAALVSVLFLWGTSIPLGIPEEWTWPRIPFSPETVWGWIVGAVFAALYAGFVWLGATRIETAARWRASAWVAGLVAAGFTWLWVVQDAESIPFSLSKVPFVLYYPQSSGYFFKARYEVDDTRAFLSGYEELMSQGDVLHVGTHPPGLFLVYRGLMALCERFPALADLVLTTQPESTRQAFDLIADNEQHRAPLLRQDRAVLWLSALLVQFAAAATVVPLYRLVRRFHSRSVAWWTAALWPTVPAVAVFIPKSDAVYPFLGLLFLWLWIDGWSRGSVLRCALAGVVLFAGMLLSLVMLPVVVLAVLVTLWEGWLCPSSDRPPQPDQRVPDDTSPRRTQGAWRSGLPRLRVGLVFDGRRLLIGATAAAIGFGVPIFVLWLACDLNLLSVWSWNYRNHAAFYDQFQRTYWKWLLVNPLELTLAIGVPVAMAAVAGVVHAARHASRQRRAGLVWSALLAGGLLWLSGKNSGEAARLWLFLMPWCLWPAAEWLVGIGQHAKPKLSRSALPLLIAQLIVCLLTVTRVSGFHFGAT